MKNKEVQIIPWALSDSNSIRCPSPRLDPSRTVFVGGLHGLINAGVCWGGSSIYCIMGKFGGSFNLTVDRQIKVFRWWSVL